MIIVERMQYGDRYQFSCDCISCNHSSYDNWLGCSFVAAAYWRFIQFFFALCILVLIFTPIRSHAQDTNVLTATVIRQSIETVYQPRHRDFVDSTAQFLDITHQHCQQRSPDTLTQLRDQFAELIVTYSGIEFYRAGPMLQANRQSRLFFWPDKRRAGERQLRALLADEKSAELTNEQLISKSVAVQGLPAIERLLFSKNAAERLGVDSNTPDCLVMIAIAKNMHSMATALNDGWASNSEVVESMYNPQSKSDNYRTEDEVLRSIVTQILVGMDVVLNRKIDPLTSDKARWKKAPLWLSEQTISMINSNMDSLRALVVDSGLARKAGLENELSFEFQTANTILQSLLAQHSLIDNDGRVGENAQSLIRALASVTGAIAVTLNDRFTQSLGVSAGFNSEDGD